MGATQLATSNAEQVCIVRKILDGLGLEPASPDEAREFLALTGVTPSDSDLCAVHKTSLRRLFCCLPCS